MVNYENQQMKISSNLLPYKVSLGSLRANTLRKHDFLMKKTSNYADSCLPTHFYDTYQVPAIFIIYKFMSFGSTFQSVRLLTIILLLVHILIYSLFMHSIYLALNIKGGIMEILLKNYNTYFYVIQTYITQKTFVNNAIITANIYSGKRTYMCISSFLHLFDPEIYTYIKLRISKHF